MDEAKARDILLKQRLVEHRISCLKEDLTQMAQDDPELTELKQSLGKLKKQRRAVRQTLESLDLEEGELLRLYYVKRMPLPYIYRKLSISRATFYRMRKKAMAHFATAYDVFK